MHNFLNVYLCKTSWTISEQILRLELHFIVFISINVLYTLVI